MYRHSYKIKAVYMILCAHDAIIIVNDHTQVIACV